jgi:hypothetical protein
MIETVPLIVPVVLFGYCEAMGFGWESLAKHADVNPICNKQRQANSIHVKELVDCILTLAPADGLMNCS